ncbi:hypothetical protein [uncultured Dokdonia sp.]|uniref:hypothetical protein n=1 Tax=uncultured Dokdonia sp. TaxID=575653 RepID=UPI0030EDE684|tara:strand:+ start:10205 stop:10936 length:732 start_codon:yes stop_codon:yes gene_type:complete
MKRILGGTFILLLISCNTISKKDKELLKKENNLLQRELELTKQEQNSDSKEITLSKQKEVEKTNLEAAYKKEPVKKPSSYTFDNFHISENRVGIFSKGMTISDVYNTIPKEQIKKKTGYGEFADDTYDDYEIYDSNGKIILILTPKQNGNTNSKINRISILDKRFKTTKKIGLNSTFGDLQKHYVTNNISPDMEHIVLDVEHINAWFSIKKTELQDGWWNEKGIDRSKIPKTAKFDGITVWWN